MGVLEIQWRYLAAALLGVAVTLRAELMYAYIFLYMRGGTGGLGVMVGKSRLWFNLCFRVSDEQTSCSQWENYLSHARFAHA
jgi:hypothetical protein